VYGIFGAIAAALGAILAYRNARSSTASFYANQVYNMTARGHLRFAIASAIIALLFLIGTLFFNVITVPLLALYAVLAILYGASFVRGATGEDE
jgi:hypothetical protein